MTTAHPRLHALTWTVWMVAAAVTVQATTNPVYITVVLLVSILVVEVHGRHSALARAFPVMIALATTFGLIRVALTVLTTHDTGSTVLFTWPMSFQLPDVFGGFTVFGTIEAEPLVRSLFEAYAVVAFIATFAAWNAVVSHHEVMRAVPRAFHEPALVVTIAIAFVPSTIAALRAVNLADRARCGGTPVKRGRLRRLVIPVVEGGLERAIALAESMESRGLGHTAPNRSERRASWYSVFALAAAMGAIVAIISRARIAAGTLAVASVALFVVAIVTASHGVERTRYRPRRITRADRALIATSVVSVASVMAWSLADETSLRWSAYPLTWPSVNVGILAALALLAAPVFVGSPRHGTASRPPERAVDTNSDATVDPTEPAWVR